MKTRSNMPLFVVECTDITKLSDSDIDLLRCGDYLVKKTGKQNHAYKVTYKEDKQGICLTYHDASCVETVSYDYTDNHWVYNSTDIAHLPINDEDVTFEGDVTIEQNLEVNGDAKLFENIVDKDGHKRFIEGNITVVSQTGVTIDYAKWSLSGTHLMFVVAGSVTAGNTCSISLGSATIDLPQWIKDKIYPLTNTDNVAYSSIKSVTSQGIKPDNYCILIKQSNNIMFYHQFPFGDDDYDLSFRVAFDLLIDNE